MQVGTARLQEPGSYVFQTKHNGNDGNCDGKGGQDKTGECGFNGNEESCFVIQAVNSCTTSFTGKLLSAEPAGSLNILSLQKRL
jgi:hypothetical protein